MPRLGGLRSGVASTSRRLAVVPRAVIVAVAAPAALPALGLRQRYEMALRVRFPQAAGRGQVFEERPNAVAALAGRVHAKRLDTVGRNVALEPLAMHSELR